MSVLHIRRLLTSLSAFVASVVLFCPALSAQPSPATSQPGWVPDKGDGTYKNPIIFADYSDPDVVRVGDDFYLVASSFNSAPGLPILHSRDLVNWSIIAHVFQQQIPRDVFAKPQHGNGVWAPSIRFHKNEFYIYYGDPDYGIYMVKARKPNGPWTTPLLIRQAKGWIDPCPFWDDDGNAYLVHAWANSRSGIKNILTINRLSPDGTKLLDDGQKIFDGTAYHPTIEGPKLYKRHGYYYVFAPAGGVTSGWQTVLRSKSIYGPYEDRIAMDQGKTTINGPHQGGWVQLKSGESWFVHFQDKGAYGRVVHLQPMTWLNDWPIVGVDNDRDGKGEPVSTYKKPNVRASYPKQVPQTSDEFETRLPGLQWQWQANFEQNWSSLTDKPGWLRLNSIPLPNEAVNLWPVPNLVLQKLPAPTFILTAKIDASGLLPNEESGLVMMGMDYSYLAVVRTETGFRLEKTVCKNAQAGNEEIEDSGVDVNGGSLLLRITVSADAVCRFSYSSDGTVFTDLGESFKARQGRWIGAKVGLFSLAQPGAVKRGYADFDWFRFE
jgi:beta-xylosidase